MRTKGKLLLILSVLYIYIPIMIFLWGWTRALWALSTSLIIIIGCRNMIIEYSGEEKEEEIKLHLPMLLLSIALIVTLCICIGFGGLYPQSGDWYKHNAVIRDLTFMDWPVYYDAYDKSMLTYYVGQYIFPCFIGKLFHSFELSNILMTIWGIVGIFLVYVHLIRVTGAKTIKKQIIVLIFMFFFCGALSLCQEVLSAVFENDMYSVGSYHWVLVKDVMLQYRSNLVMLRWVYPQVIVPWLITILFMEHYKNIKYYVPLILPAILFGTFSFGTLALIAMTTALMLLLNRNITIKEIFHPFNILAGLSLGAISFFYFLGNIMEEKPDYSSLSLYIYKGKDIFIYLIFCFFMFGIYASCTWKNNKKNIFWYLSVGILLILPWFRMGLYNDIVMSASIPALFMIMIFVLKMLFDERDSMSVGVKKGIIIMVFLIGCLYPIRELRDNIRDNGAGVELADGYTTLKWFTDRRATDVAEDLIYNYYTYEPEGKIFNDYIARKGLGD